MAQSAIDKIPPGPKLDELTAEKVFGWKNVHKREGSLVGKKQDKAGHWRRAKVPNYSTNPLHSYSVENRMKQLGRMDRYKKELSKITRSKNIPSGGDQSCGTIRPGHSSTEIGRRIVNIEVVRRVLLWSTIINYGILLVWFPFFIQAHDWMYQLHGRWFHLSVEQFDMLHYAGMSVYKIGIIMLNLVPYFALRIIKPEAASRS
jgi:hypothetical protein